MDDYFELYSALRADLLAHNFATAPGPDPGLPFNVNLLCGVAVQTDDNPPKTATIDNPLLFTGLLMTCLAVEFHLAGSQAGPLLSATLDSLGTLYKFRGEFAGYPIRFDPVSGGVWRPGSPNPGNFSWTETGDYVYSAPDYAAESARILPHDAYRRLDPDSQAAYENNAYWPFVDACRRWEPSGDELIGLVMGYSMVYRFVPDPQIRAKVVAQVSDLANYLSTHGYFLQRPSGGLVARGPAFGTTVAEYAFQRVFTQITGDPHPARLTTEDLLRNLGVWPVVETAWSAVTVASLDPLTAALKTLLGAGDLPSGASSATLTQSLVLLADCDIFDSQWGYAVGNDSTDNKTELALAHLFRSLPVAERMATFFAGSMAGKGNAAFFPPYLALACFATGDLSVGTSYAGYLAGRRISGFSKLTDPPAMDNVAWPVSVGNLLYADDADVQQALSSALAIFAKNAGTLPKPCYGPALYQMTATALAWLARSLRGAPLVNGYPQIPLPSELDSMFAPTLQPKSPVPRPVVSLPAHTNVTEDVTVMVGPHDGEVIALYVNPGDEIQIDASGTVNPGFIFGAAFGPEGALSSGTSVAFPRFDTGSKRYALVAQFGEYGAFLHVGAHLTRMRYRGSKFVPLYLAVNTDDWTKGSGQFTCRVQRWGSTLRVAMQPPAVKDGQPAQVTFSCVDAGDPALILDGAVLLGGVVIGRTNQSLTATFASHVEKEWVPPDPTGPPAHRAGHWHTYVVRPEVEIQVTGYPTAGFVVPT